MTLEENKATEDYVVVAPKISRQCATQLQTFATAKGISLYEAMQTEFCQALLARATSGRHYHSRSGHI